MLQAECSQSIRNMPAIWVLLATLLVSHIQRRPHSLQDYCGLFLDAHPFLKSGLPIWQAAAGAATAQNTSGITPVGAPVSVNFSSFQLGSNDVPLTDPLLAKASNETSPDQIHISLGGRGKNLACNAAGVIFMCYDLTFGGVHAVNTSTVYLTWVTGFSQFYLVGSDPVPPPPLASVVMYGTQPGSLDLRQNGTSNYYMQVQILPRMPCMQQPQGIYFADPLCVLLLQNNTGKVVSFLLLWQIACKLPVYALPLESPLMCISRQMSATASTCQGASTPSSSARCGPTRRTTTCAQFPGIPLAC